MAVIYTGHLKIQSDKNECGDFSLIWQKHLNSAQKRKRNNFDEIMESDGHYIFIKQTLIPTNVYAIFCAQKLMGNLFAWEKL